MKREPEHRCPVCRGDDVTVERAFWIACGVVVECGDCERRWEERRSYALCDCCDRLAPLYRDEGEGPVQLEPFMDGPGYCERCVVLCSSCGDVATERRDEHRNRECAECARRAA